MSLADSTFQSCYKACYRCNEASIDATMVSDDIGVTEYATPGNSNEDEFCNLSNYDYT